MSDTPRTDAVLASYFNPWPRLRDLSRELERELNAANATIRQQQLLEEENMRLKAHIIGPSALIDELEIERDRIANLIRLGDKMAEWCNGKKQVEDWNKFKEDFESE